tara:strand:+ start:10192 stop:10431 length:240 start_codon:yes stop_codon:yes gene_type:complete
MATKTLTITEESYDMLVARKYENESFSQEIKRILSKKSKKNLMDFFGILSEEEGKNIENFINKSRKSDMLVNKSRYNLK